MERGENRELLLAERARRPLSVIEWVRVALRENGGDRMKAIVWVHQIWGPNPTTEQLHALAKIITYLVEEDVLDS